MKERKGRGRKHLMGGQGYTRCTKCEREKENKKEEKEEKEEEQKEVKEEKEEEEEEEEAKEEEEEEEAKEEEEEEKKEERLDKTPILKTNKSYCYHLFSCRISSLGRNSGLRRTVLHVLYNWFSWYIGFSRRCNWQQCSVVLKK